jgi:UDPglucose 6-dehydrogenase
MKITIAGYGFVGKAMEAYLKECSITPKIVDPEYYRILGKDLTCGLKISDTDADGVIICVSTPQAETGECNMSNVFDVLNDTDPDTPVLIKSTISIEGWEQIIELFPSHTISFSPEFLRAKTAIEDMLNTKTIYIGGGHYYFWERVFQRATKLSKIVHAKPEELILAKYFRNSFLATKVAFFNQIYDLCEATNIDFSKVSTLITEDSRIGQSHTEVTTERGFGGHCFPKDTQAIIKTAHEKGVDLSLLREAIRYNNNIRKGTT